MQELRRRDEAAFAGLPAWLVGALCFLFAWIAQAPVSADFSLLSARAAFELARGEGSSKCGETSNPLEGTSPRQGETDGELGEWKVEFSKQNERAEYGADGEPPSPMAGVSPVSLHVAARRQLIDADPSAELSGHVRGRAHTDSFGPRGPPKRPRARSSS